MNQEQRRIATLFGESCASLLYGEGGRLDAAEDGVIRQDHERPDFLMVSSSRRLLSGVRVVEKLHEPWLDFRPLHSREFLELLDRPRAGVLLNHPLVNGIPCSRESGLD